MVEVRKQVAQKLRPALEREIREEMQWDEALRSRGRIWAEDEDTPTQASVPLGEPSTPCNRNAEQDTSGLDGRTFARTGTEDWMMIEDQIFK
ncbi:hypothetical protein BU23DRAFT_13029 [Bimuria novae-zelandiae CBS 107.79]|uniref:Uncharacterized protein n=1 Tax=Bimuria novae-zelandiae CBS 107.79 TaxID=1447943 RepID=A0A6A5VJI3_9PLEO|nr:hypothetical protein BU23DRAFT_13029 [Bimuria novae-zelandiae CBS 107.79]